MTQFFLARDVYGCEVGDGAVFLSLRTNKYHGVPASALNALRTSVTGWPGTRHPEISLSPTENIDDSILHELLAYGLLTEVPIEANFIGCTPTHALGSVGMRHRDRASTFHDRGQKVAFVSAWVGTLALLKAGRLGFLVRRALTRKEQLLQKTNDWRVDRAIALALNYRRLRPWVYRSSDNCLLDSLVLTTFLNHYSVPSILVLGVKTKPFAAHAWVQTDSIVLNDKAENVQMYAPIVVA